MDHVPTDRAGEKKDRGCDLNDAPSNSGLGPVVDRWIGALREMEPNLPRPVVDAMVQNVVKGALGASLSGLEESLIRLEAMNVESMTGSEARTTLAILNHMYGEVENLRARIQRLWVSVS